jgi:hypothetical protein
MFYDYIYNLIAAQFLLPVYEKQAFYNDPSYSLQLPEAMSFGALSRYGKPPVLKINTTQRFVT